MGFAVQDKYRSAVLITGLVTFIAAYHYMRIFNSWVEAYSYTAGGVGGNPVLTGVPFNDAYRYMDWLLTVPLLLMAILFVMNLDPAVMSSKSWTLGIGSALMIVSGYYGELVVTGDLTPLGSAGSSQWSSSCSLSTSSLWAFQKPPPLRRMPQSGPRSELLRS